MVRKHIYIYISILLCAKKSCIVTNILEEGKDLDQSDITDNW